MAQPGTSSLCSINFCGAGQTITTPPCSPPRGPGLASDAATRVWGTRPGLHAAAARASQFVSCSNTTAS
eukprot:6297163-Lingulodinium_polyedra.AAC.1